VVGECRGTPLPARAAVDLDDTPNKGSGDVSDNWRRGGDSKYRIVLILCKLFILQCYIFAKMSGNRAFSSFCRQICYSSARLRKASFLSGNALSPAIPLTPSARALGSAGNANPGTFLKCSNDRLDHKKGASRKAQPPFSPSQMDRRYFFGRFLTRSSIFVLISAGTSVRLSFFFAVLSAASSAAARIALAFFSPPFTVCRMVRATALIRTA